MKIIRKAAGETAEEFGANSAVAVTRAKSRMIENAEQNVPFTLDELSNEVFAENEVMKEAFAEKIREAGMPAGNQCRKSQSGEEHAQSQAEDGYGD